jgi:hypothetical protein
MASTSTTPCTYKSVTLAANEQFTLPPGAQIISASGGLDSFDSTCTKPTSVETPVTYEFVWAASQDSYSNATEMFEDDNNNRMIGIVLNLSQEYGFSSPLETQWYGSDYDLQSRFNSITALSGLFTNASLYYKDHDESVGINRGIGSLWRFTTIPSIGDNMEMLFQTVFSSSKFGDLTDRSFFYRTKPYRV